MLQTCWYGRDATRFMESLVVADLLALPIGSSTLSLFTNVNGGIIDDAVITKTSEHAYYVVSNAGCAEKDMAHIKTYLTAFQNQGGDVCVEAIDKSLIALQGPKSVNVMELLSGENFDSFPFMSSRAMVIQGLPIHITRCGYTGEDGFEISVSHDHVEKLASLLISHRDVKLAGLGARDSLRLEAGLCLYGNDLDENINPCEGIPASLIWTIGHRRRLAGGFLGSDKIVPQLKGAAVKRRVGLLIEGAPARQGAEIFSEGVSVGMVTSGCPSPVLKKNIAMAYVSKGSHKQGTQLMVKVRNKMQAAQVTKMPFVEHQYWRI